MKELRPYLRLLLARRGAVALGTALLLATVLSALGLLALSGWFITATGVTAAAWAAGQRVVFDIFLPGAGIRFFALSRTVGRYFERIVSHDTALAIQAALRVQLFASLARLPAPARLRDSSVLHRLTADVDALDNLLLRVVSPLAASALLLALLAAALGWLAAPAMALVVAVLALLMLPLCRAALRGGALPGHRLVVRHERLRDRVLESLDGLAELRSAGTLPMHAAASRVLSERLAATRHRRACAQAGHEAAAGLLVQLAAVAALLLGLALYAEGRIAAALAVLAALAILGLGELLGGLPQALHRLGETRAAARRLQHLSMTHGEVAASGRSYNDGETPRMRAGAAAGRDGNRVDDALAIHNLVLYHPDRVEAALENLSLRVTRGERIAVVGASGSGKSSLVTAVTRLVEPAGGAMTLFGMDAATTGARAWRAAIGCLTQETLLYADSVRANLLLARPDADDAALWRALHTAALDDVVRELPYGLETWIGEHGTRLSGGQARRLALARVVLRDAPLVLLDEPFTGLDAATAATVGARLDVWLEGRTALLLAHDTSALPRVDRVLSMEER